MNLGIEIYIHVQEMENKTVSPHQPKYIMTIPSSTVSPNISRRRIQEAIETDSDNQSIDKPTVFIKSSPRKKLQEARYLDVDAGEVKEISQNFVSSIFKGVIFEQSKTI